MEIPTARVIDDGFARNGYAESRPYKWFTTSMGAFPGLELSFRLTETTNTTALSDEYGSHKDKAFDIKYQLLPESKYFPAFSLGLHDFHGTKLFPAKYIAASRQIYPFDMTLGFGTDRLEGFFGGIEWAVTDKLHLMTEYNPIDYTSDKLKDDNHQPVIPDGKDTPFNVGIRYMPVEGVDLGVTYQRGNKLGFTARLELDVGKELMPKKPDPLFWGKYDPDKKAPREKTLETTKEWLQEIKEEVEKIDMKAVSVSVKQQTLTVYCTNTKYLSNQKAVGRIYRIMLFCSPDEIDTLEVVLTRQSLPILSASIKRDHFKKFVFDKIDEQTLNRLIQIELHQSVKPKKELTNTSPATIAAPKTAEINEAKSTQSIQKAQKTDDVPQEITVRSDKSISFDWGIKPDLDLYLNDPSGFFKCRLGASPYASMSFWEGSLISGRVFVPIYSNIESSNEDVEDPVKSDSWKYKGKDIRFERLEFNQLVKLTPRSFAMAGFGYFENMYAGASGEVLTFIGNGDLALGVQYDYAIKRKPKTPFELMDFKRTTCLGNIYYDIRPLDIKIHAQYGKFLARDVGWRLTVTRSYDNGVDIGGWYSFTDTDDLTEFNKGYHDKGVFIAIPVQVLSPVEKRSKYSYVISPWTRDVAATVSHSQSLYGVASDLMPGEFKAKIEKIAE